MEFESPQAEAADPKGDASPSVGDRKRDSSRLGTPSPPVANCRACGTLAQPAAKNRQGSFAGVFVLVLLLCLLALLVPAWMSSWSESPGSLAGRAMLLLFGNLPQEARDAAREDLSFAWLQLLKQMFSPWLLPALGFLWVLQHRGVDLSVWMSFYLGSAVAATVVSGGVPNALYHVGIPYPLQALGAVILAGLAMGLANVALAVLLRLPVWLATMATAIIGTTGVLVLIGGAPLRLEREVLARWSGGNRPLVLAAAFFSAGVLAAWSLVRSRHAARAQEPAAPGVAGGLLNLPQRRGGRREEKKQKTLVTGGCFFSQRSLRLCGENHAPDPVLKTAALLGSGVMSALGGLCWLARSGEAPAPGWIIGDLRLVAAAVLAGGFVLGGAEGTSTRLVALRSPALLLPPAMLASTAWWLQRVWDMPGCPVAVNLLLLAAMALGGQWAAQRATRYGVEYPNAMNRVWRPSRMWPILAALGILALAATAGTLPAHVERLMLVGGLTVWLIGAAGAYLQPPRGLPTDD